jgi:hypothetical protein
MTTKAPSQQKPENPRASDMTLRDYIAVKAMEAYYNRISVNTPRERVAKEAYDQADAMLDERQSR